MKYNRELSYKIYSSWKSILQTQMMTLLKWILNCVTIWMIWIIVTWSISQLIGKRSCFINYRKWTRHFVLSSMYKRFGTFSLALLCNIYLHLYNCISLVSGTCDGNFRSIIFKRNIQNCNLGAHCEISTGQGHAPLGQSVYLQAACPSKL